MASIAILPKKMHIFFFFLILTCISGDTTVAGDAHSRRALHQPFFPEDSPIIPPAQPPTALPPSSSSSSSSIPFLSTPTKSPPNDQPFFPSFHPPPPPPPSSSSSASFPANISTLTLPASPKPRRVSSKLVPIAITLVIAAFVVTAIVVVLRIQKRRRYSKDSEAFGEEKGQRSNNGAGNNGGGASNSYNRIPKLTRPSQTSSEFLYLGTLVNSHGGIDATGASVRDARGDDDSSLQKMGSPELRPLPPLTGSCGGRSQTILQNAGYESTELESRDEEFYSPVGARPGFRQPLGGATGDCEQRRSVGSGSSSFYSSSSSGSPARSVSLSISPPVSLSPESSRLKSPELVVIQTAPPPSRPAPPLPPAPVPEPRIIRSPVVGLSKDSLESSPRLSNSSNDQTSSPARIPPPPPPPTTRRQPLLNPPVLIKPAARPVAVTSHQPLFSPTETLPENLENLETGEKTPKPKLKPLHWDKVRACSDREMVWDHLKSSSFKLNEEMIETLFIIKTPNSHKSNEKSTTKHPIIPSPISHENQVLDPKKSQNIAISLRALSVTIEEVCDALLEGNVDMLGTEILESLMKMAPTKEEERKLKEYRDESPMKLGPAEKFLKSVLDVPFAFKRVYAMLYVSNFDSEVEYLKSSFQSLEAACEELKNNRMFLKLLEAVLKTGNRMNVGTNRGDAHAFKLDTLLKLIDVKAADGKTTLLHFVVQEITKSERARLSTVHNATNHCTHGLQLVSSLSSDLSNVKKAAAMDSEALNGDTMRLSKGIYSIIDIVRLNESSRFSDSMNEFLKRAQDEIVKIQARESVALSLVKEITEYFHGGLGKEEARPFRIFMVVRDFLTVLDRVCNEVGAVNDRVVIGSGHKFAVPVNPMAGFDGFRGRREYSSCSSDDESSCSL